MVSSPDTYIVDMGTKLLNTALLLVLPMFLCVRVNTSSLNLFFIHIQITETSQPRVTALGAKTLEFSW